MSKIDEDEELDFNLESILKQYAETRGENKFELESLLSLIKKSQANSSVYTVRFLEQLRQNVSLLSPDLFEHNVINTILYEIKWATNYSRDPHVLGLFAEFLVDLNSAYTSYVYKSLSMIIKSLFPLVNEPTTPDLINCEFVYSIAHTLIDNLFRIAPACQSQTVKIVEQSFPYMIKESHVQRAFISNLLRLASNHAALRLPLLEICVQKLLKIDVNLNRESMIEAEKIDTDNEDDDLKTQESIIKQEMKHPLADRLDTMMQCVFEYIKKSIIEPSTGQFSWDRCRALYKDLLFTFDKYILSTYGSNHAQFIMFYMCSQRVQLAEGFLDYLWKKFTAINSNPITKQTCAYYIGSYLARAKYVSIDMCTASLQLMISWVHAYADKQAISQSNYSDHASNFQLHRTYYSLCQTIFYVIIFRSRQLFDERFIDLVRTWKLNDIVSCKLNPLKYCFTAVRDKFAKVAYVNRVAYCYSIIDANKRIAIPHSSQSKKTPAYSMSEATKKGGGGAVGPAASLSSGNNPLDSFFPFDPYILKRSRSHIDDIYIEFRQVDDLNSDDEMEHDDEEDEEDEDEDIGDDDDDDEEEEDDDDDDEEDHEFEDDEEDEYSKIVKENLKEDLYL